MTTRKLDCAYFQQLLGALADDELGRSEKLSVETHLAECDTCRRQRASLASMLSDVRALPQTNAGPNFLVDLRRRIDRGEANAPSGFLATLDWFRVNLALGSCAVACLCILFVRQDSLRQAAQNFPGAAENIVISDASAAAPVSSVPSPSEKTEADGSNEKAQQPSPPAFDKKAAPAPSLAGQQTRSEAADRSFPLEAGRESEPAKARQEASPTARRLARLAEAIRQEADALAAEPLQSQPPPQPEQQSALGAELAKDNARGRVAAARPEPAQDAPFVPAPAPAGSGFGGSRGGAFLAKSAPPEPAAELGGQFLSEEKESSPVVMGLHASAPRAPFSSSAKLALDSGASLGVRTAAYSVATDDLEAEKSDAGMSDEIASAPASPAPSEAQDPGDARGVDPSLTGDGQGVSRELLLHYFGKRVLADVESMTRARQEGTVLIKVTRLRPFLRALRDSADEISVADVLETSGSSFEFSAIASGGKEGLEALAQKLGRMPGAQPSGLMFEKIREKGTFATRVMVTLGPE